MPCWKTNWIMSQGPLFPQSMMGQRAVVGHGMNVVAIYDMLNRGKGSWGEMCSLMGNKKYFAFLSRVHVLLLAEKSYVNLWNWHIFARFLLWRSPWQVDFPHGKCLDDVCYRINHGRNENDLGRKEPVFSGLRSKKLEYSHPLLW